MHITETDSLTEKQKIEIIQLWNSEYPAELALGGLPDFEQYLQTLEDKHHILLLSAGQEVKGWLVYFLRNNDQCFAMLLDASLQGQGWGSKLLTLAKQRTVELHGWVIDSSHHLKENGIAYQSPIGFYMKNGFEVFPEMKLTKSNIEGIRVTWRKKQQVGN